MAKETYYFSHDYNARNDAKVKRLLTKLGYEGYGLFWAIIEDLYNNANALHLDYDCIAFDLRSDVDTIKSIVNDFGLFIIKDNYFYSSSVETRLNQRNEKSNKARESASYRWDKKKEYANALPTHYDSNAIKESKGKESKGKEIIKPNGLGEATASPTAKILYSSIEKTVMGIYEFLQTKPDVPDAYKDYWNLFAKAKGLACIDKISDSRKRKLNVRMRDKNFDFTTILKTAGKSEFLLKGKWFSFDWIIENDSNYLKVIEGNYEKKEEETTLSNQQNQNLSAAVRAIEGVV